VADIASLELPPSAVLMQMANPLVSRSIHVAATLGIADHLGDGPRTVEELATATGTHAPSLHRLLRALASVGIFSETVDGAFELTALAQPLRADAPDSVRPFLFVTGAVAGPAVAELEYTVRTGEPGFDRARGTSWWEYFASDPQAARIHDEMFVDQSNAIAPLLVDICDLDGVGTIVDIGGGYGGLSLPLLQRFPAMRGVVVDLPHAESGARAHIAAAGLDDRCEFVAGDFFAGVPTGDVYLLKHVLRDWPDDDVVRLLARSADAAAPGARLVIVDWVIGPRNEPDLAKLADLFVMLVLRGGRDRTADELRTLLEAVGADLEVVAPLPTGQTVLQARFADR
jgi:hypothetical protein